MKAPTPAESPKPPRHPNVLIIVLDAVRFDATAFDPKNRDATPFMRTLLKDGVNFTNCYSTVDATPGSHFSLLTGYESGWMGDIDQPDISMAYQLKSLGYRTFGIAANGNLSQKTMRVLMPFDHYVNLYETWENMPAEEKAKELPAVDGRIAAYRSKPTDFYRAMVWSSARAVLDRLAVSLSGKQPFFGFLNMVDAHDPYMPDPKRYDIAGEQAIRPGEPVAALRYRDIPDELLHPDTIADPQRRELVKQKLALTSGAAAFTTFDLDEATIAVYRRRYGAEVWELDRAVRRIFQMLQRKKLLESTIVVITADHGEAFGEQHLITHSFKNSGPREVTNHVPLFVRLPRAYRLAGITMDDNCTNADVAPTLYELAGLDAKPLWQKTIPGNYGHSLLPAARAKQQAREPAPQKLTATVQSKPMVGPRMRQQQDSEAYKRLKSLGYIH